MRIRQLIFALLLCIALCECSFAQGIPDSLTAGAGKITRNYINAISEKSARISGDIDNQTEKYLDALEKQENKIKNKLVKVDSLAANNIFANTSQKYTDIKNKLKNNQLIKSTGRYLPWLDSAGTSLKFLAGNNPLISNVNGNASKITGALSKVKTLENQFKQAGSIKEFIRQRKEYLTEQLRNYNLGSDLKKYNQTAYYYTQQINEYKQIMDDPEKAVTKAMSLLEKIPAFQRFFHQYGELAGLFDVPEDYATNMTGLQTIQQVQNTMTTQIQNIGPNGAQDVSQSLSAAQSELSKLRNQFPSSGSTEDMPDFKPREEKTKTFLKRLQYGINMQTVHSNFYFPSTTDFALSLGYKLGGSNVIGISGAYKVGWGKDISHIKISSQGLSLRSFIDIKLKKSFFASGGFEYNYQQPFRSSRELFILNSWQRSGLIGVSKIVSLKTKFFKQTKLQVLWDPLSYSQIPKGQPFKFRVGYNF
jgi:hypothetical protein